LARQAARSEEDEALPVYVSEELASSDALFELVPQYTQSGPISLDGHLRLRHVATGYWLHYAPADEGGGDADRVRRISREGSADADGPRHTSVVVTKVMHDQDVFGILAVADAEADDMSRVRSASEQLELFYNDLEFSTDVSAASLDLEPLSAVPPQRPKPKTRLDLGGSGRQYDTRLCCRSYSQSSSSS
jgi:hypothetical protein